LTSSVKILVAVKQVARLAAAHSLQGLGGELVAIPEEALEWAQNEWDPFALEAALRLCEESGGGEVIVASVGGVQAEESLRAGLAMGADRAVRVWDPMLRGADPLALAAVLAKLAALEQPDVILCGAQSADAANAATGVALAGLLDLAHVTVVSAVERDGGALVVGRELDGGAVEMVRVAMPALLTIQTGANQPRRANLRAIKQAREQPIQTLAPSAIGLGEDELSDVAGARTVRFLEPLRGGANMIEGPASAVASRIAEIVAEELRA
jgi:electron transfer flavoprotein beta subunit